MLSWATFSQVRLAAAPSFSLNGVTMHTLDVSKFGESSPIEGFPYRVFSSGKVVAYRGQRPVREVGFMNAKGAVRVLLSDTKLVDGKATRVLGREFIHHLVAKAFIPNPQGLRDVRHKDGDKLNNAVENLEWVSRSTSMVDAFARKGDWLAKHRGKNAVAIYSIDSSNNVTHYPSAQVAAKTLGTASQAAGIRKAIELITCFKGVYWARSSTPLETILPFIQEKRDLKSASILQSAVSSSQDDPAPQPNE